MPVKNGSEYIERIDNNSPDVWIGLVQKPVSNHIAFKGLMATQASMYDMQHAEDSQATMVYSSPLTGDPVGLSFKQPKTKKDLALRRQMMQAWASIHHGFLGRSPDYMNTAIMAFSAAAGVLEEKYPEYASNLQRYYEYCRENDITLSHVFVQPKAGRVSTFLRTFEEPEAARIMEKNKDGIVIRGAFLLDTQGATSDEILVFPTPFSLSGEEVSPYSFAFAVPSNLKGVSFVCRESFVRGESTYNYPLSSRFEEMDTLVIFDEAAVPWDRVFVCGDEKMAYRLLDEVNFIPMPARRSCAKTLPKRSFC
jgi:4-hydroxyphenylacetate 3-monooxygenase